MANVFKSFRIEILLTLASIGVVLLISFALYKEVFQFRSEMEAKEAPEIEFEMKSGIKTSLGKKRGEVILLNFWASWCAPCIQEMPSLKMLELHLREKGLLLLLFNLEEEEDEVKNRLKMTDFPENLIFSYSKKSLDLYQVSGIPVSFLIDKKGVIRHVFMGPRDWVDTTIIREIESLLAEAN